jgi:hypothetical protein
VLPRQAFSLPTSNTHAHPKLTPPFPSRCHRVQYPQIIASSNLNSTHLGHPYYHRRSPAQKWPTPCILAPTTIPAPMQFPQAPKRIRFSGSQSALSTPRPRNTFVPHIPIRQSSRPPEPIHVYTEFSEAGGKSFVRRALAKSKP